MTLTLHIHPEAASELLEAAKWHESEQANLGDEFMTKIEDAVRDVLDWPKAAPLFPDWDKEPPVRSKNVQVFPYRVLYYLTDISVVIVAYAHTRRRPRYWQYRTNN